MNFNIIRFFYSICLVILLHFCSYSASKYKEYTSDNYHAIKEYIKAKNFLDKKDMVKAVESLTVAITADTAFLEANLLLAKILYQEDLKNKDLKSEKYLKRIVERENNKNYEIIFDLAYLNFIVKKDYFKSLYYINKYIECIYKRDFDKSPKRNSELVNKIKSQSEYKYSLVNNPVEIDTQNLKSNINTYLEEYLPFFTADRKKIFFTRRDEVGKSKDNEGNLITIYDENFYYSDFVDSNWQEAKLLETPFNSERREGALSISPDGNVIYFTICNKPDGFGNCDLYYSKKTENGWGEPENLGDKVNTENWESQPSISPNGNDLYFVSSRPGGIGGLDIWVTSKKNDEWTTPVNLGPYINSSGNEQSPFMHYDLKTFYYVSDGPKSLGGFDILYSKINNGEFTNSLNLGYPINNEYDQGSIFVANDGLMGFYSTNGPNGYGGNDIYSFKIPQNAQPIETKIIVGNVYDFYTKNAVLVNLNFVNNEDNYDFYNSFNQLPDGNFLVTLKNNSKYTLHIDHNKYEKYISIINTNDYSLENNKVEDIFLFLKSDSLSKEDKLKFDLANKELIKINTLQKNELMATTDSLNIKKSQISQKEYDSISHNITNTPLSNKLYDSINYFNSEIKRLIAENKIDSVKILNKNIENINLKIQIDNEKNILSAISNFAKQKELLAANLIKDNVIKAAKNLELANESDNLVKNLDKKEEIKPVVVNKKDTIVKEIAKQEDIKPIVVNKKDTIVKEMAKQEVIKPIVVNKKDTIVKEIAKQEEIKPIVVNKKDTIVKEIAKQEDNKQSQNLENENLIKYNDEKLKKIENKKETITEKSDEIFSILEDLESMQHKIIFNYVSQEIYGYTLPTIFYYKNSYLINDYFYSKLDNLVSFLNKHPELKLEIGGHADTTGNDIINLRISNDRALGVKKYLVDKGLNENRFVIVGYSSKKPIMSNETKLGRSYNRRVEFIINNN